MARAYARTIISKKSKKAAEPESFHDPVSPQVKVAERRRVSPKLSDQIAGDSSCFYLNYYYPHGKEHFEDFPKLQYVSKFYPYADGGPLYVDEVRYEWEYKECLQKKDVMDKYGMRYIILMPETKLEEALTQLGLICNGQQASQTYVPG